MSNLTECAKVAQNRHCLKVHRNAFSVELTMSNKNAFRFFFFWTLGRFLCLSFDVYFRFAQCPKGLQNRSGESVKKTLSLFHTRPRFDISIRAMWCP